MQETLKKIKEFIKSHWGKMLIVLAIVIGGIAATTHNLKTKKLNSGGNKTVSAATISVDSNAPPVYREITPPVYQPKTDAGVATNSRPQPVPGQQPSPTATAVTINGNVNIENLNLAIAVDGGTAATSTIEKHWYDMPPTRIEPMLDNDGGKKVVGQYEDVIFVKPDGWGVIPEVLDATLGRDYLALKNKGTRENPQWVDAANYHYTASEFRVRSLKYPIRVRFVLMPKD